MIFGSVCSGIEAASVAWEPLGWKAEFYSEIDPFPCAVLKHRFPEVLNYGDMTKYKGWPHGRIDALVGGTPCQSFSVAGLRKGLDDPRGNLMLTFGAIANYYKPRWVIWENVPGVLSSNKGRDFGTFLGMLAELGYGFAYRVLDAQFFGVAQRRRRVFVVGYLGDWRRPAAVLFESESLRGDTSPSRESGKGTTGIIAGCFEPRSPDGHARMIGDISPTLNRMGGGQREPCVIMSHGQANAEIRGDGGAPTLSCNHEAPILATNTVRRLTPRECERLQGFPDDWTKIPWRGRDAEDCPDGPRYKACGNSMAVPVMRWIGERMQKVENEYGGKL